MKKASFVLLACVSIVSMSACSMDSLKRTGYEIVEDMREQQCDKDLSSDCAPRESYDVYQKKLDDSENSK